MKHNLKKIFAAFMATATIAGVLAAPSFAADTQTADKGVVKFTPTLDGVIDPEYTASASFSISGFVKDGKLDPMNAFTLSNTYAYQRIKDLIECRINGELVDTKTYPSIPEGADVQFSFKKDAPDSDKFVDVKVYFLWDDTALYMAIEVKDDEVVVMTEEELAEIALNGYDQGPGWYDSVGGAIRINGIQNTKDYELKTLFEAEDAELNDYIDVKFKAVPDGISYWSDNGRLFGYTTLNMFGVSWYEYAYLNTLANKGIPAIVYKDGKLVDTNGDDIFVINPDGTIKEFTPEFIDTLIPEEIDEETGEVIERGTLEDIYLENNGGSIGALVMTDGRIAQKLEERVANRECYGFKKTDKGYVMELKLEFTDDVNAALHEAMSFVATGFTLIDSTNTRNPEKQANFNGTNASCWYAVVMPDVELKLLEEQPIVIPETTEAPAEETKEPAVDTQDPTDGTGNVGGEETKAPTDGSPATADAGVAVAAVALAAAAAFITLKKRK